MENLIPMEKLWIVVKCDVDCNGISLTGVSYDSGDNLTSPSWTVDYLTLAEDVLSACCEAYPDACLRRSEVVSVIDLDFEVDEFPGYIGSVFGTLVFKVPAQDFIESGGYLGDNFSEIEFFGWRGEDE